LPEVGRRDRSLPLARKLAAIDQFVSSLEEEPTAEEREALRLKSKEFSRRLERPSVHPPHQKL
jgi:hypothetical protein